MISDGTKPQEDENEAAPGRARRPAVSRDALGRGGRGPHGGLLGGDSTFSTNVLKMKTVSPGTKMTDGNLSTSANGVALLGVLEGRPGNHVPDLQQLSLKAPRPLPLPENGPKPKAGPVEDRHSLQSVDSGIPTLEIGNPEPVPCSAAHVKRKPSESGAVPERACQSACPLPSYTPPASGAAEWERGVRRSSTFPRTGYDAAEPYSPAGKALSRSDDVSVCSASSLGTELSATLSGSTEDILDLVVTSSSSAIVTLESDDGPRFTDVTLGSAGEARAPCRQDRVGGAEDGSKSKILGPFSNFFTRNLLARKQNARLDKQNDLGWKLFGKVPLRENAQKDSKKVQKEYEDKAGRPSKPPSPKQNVRKNLDFEPLSTTALILEDRPANLPAKPAEEAQKHRQQYEEMVVQAKKRELKEAQRRRRQLEERCRLEDSIGNAVLTWNNEVLPNWDTMWCSRKVRDLWWQGVPPSVRGKVWSLAIGNELNITHELFDICLARAKERWRSFSTGGSEAENEDAGFSAADREASLELIKLDISRTFPNLCIFQQGGPYHDTLHSILGAYTCYRPDVGYVQGMSFIAAVLILNLDTADAFIAFSNLLNKPCQMAFFRVDHGLMLTYFAAFEVFFEENLPKLFAHFKKNNLTPDIYLIDWIFTLYSKSLPLDLACRIWDVFCRDGEEFLFRAALGVLKLFEDILTKMDFIHMAQFLTRLPEDLPADEVFASIATVQMQSRNKKWAQVHGKIDRLSSLLSPERQDGPEYEGPLLAHLASGCNLVRPGSSRLLPAVRTGGSGPSEAAGSPEAALPERTLSGEASFQDPVILIGSPSGDLFFLLPGARLVRECGSESAANARSPLASPGDTRSCSDRRSRGDGGSPSPAPLCRLPNRRRTQRACAAFSVNLEEDGVPFADASAPYIPNTFRFTYKN
ncbi:TBC1 domain family member 14 [Suricata suricatta]|uniref:TBC1 domain family member 14 n=1 Tax=Suricata suricatta TaxID=37032 RepID=UPI0011560413|nr:TBC1 domain family member 14 [Suricata suricatta]